MKKIIFILVVCLVVYATFVLSGCSLKGKYFVDSEYIIATASLTSTTTNTAGEVTYGIDIHHESDIKLNYLKYKCELYANGKVVETFEGEVPMNGLYSKFIPLKTTKEYDHAKVVCTGWSDENPKNFVRLNAKSSAEMLQCEHNHFVSARIGSLTTNSKRDYLIIKYISNTAYGDFRFFYENYVSINVENLKVCLDCGYYEI